MYASVPSAEQRLRHCWLKPAGCWHLDEMVARIVGETVYLWRVVDQRRSVSIGVEILALLYSAG